MEVEHSGAAICSAFSPLAAVMEVETALMAVMRLDVHTYILVHIFWHTILTIQPKIALTWPYTMHRCIMWVTANSNV